MYDYNAFSAISKSDLDDLISHYPFLKYHSKTVADYIPPQYYDSLLKDYLFYGRDDLAYLRKFFLGIKEKYGDNSSILELGSGSGRASSICLDTFPLHQTYDMVDLSNDMINFVKEKFSSFPNIKTHLSDHLKYIDQTNISYDIIFSLWSYNHSVYQHIEHKGVEAGIQYVSRIVQKLISKTLKPGSSLFIIHVDKLSEEQQILDNQWRQDFPDLHEVDRQHRSKEILDSVLSKYSDKNYLDYEVRHLEGDPIEYKNLDEALEIFLNFHMETEYNRHKDLAKRINQMIKDFEKYKMRDGSYLIRPGCFIYEIYKRKN